MGVAILGSRSSAAFRCFLHDSPAGGETFSKISLSAWLTFPFHLFPYAVHPGCRSGDPSEAKSRDKHLIKV